MKKSIALLCTMILALGLWACGNGAAKEPSSAPGSGGTAAESGSAEAPSGAEPVVAEGLPAMTVTGETDLPGNFFLSFVYSRNLIMMDGKGNIVWSKHEEQPWKDKNTGWWDFKKHIVDGKTYYSYHDQIGTYDNYGFEGFAPGERVILDENFNEVKRIKFEKSDVTEKDTPVDGHDFLMIDLDHYILSGYLKGIITNHPDYPNGSSVVYSYLQEVDNGEAVWDWKSVDYPELYDLVDTNGSETANDFANAETDVPDIVHFNAMRLNDEGDLVCSFRHLSTILCLDRTKRTDQIKWKLSGAGDEFGLAEEQKTSCQHYVTVDGDNVMAFSNGNKTGRTRILSYKIDPEKRKTETVRCWYLDNKFSSACGSVQRLENERYVIGWGRAENDAECMSVVDFATGEKQFSITLENRNNFTYRCVYYE